MYFPEVDEAISLWISDCDGENEAKHFVGKFVRLVEEKLRSPVVVEVNCKQFIVDFDSFDEWGHTADLEEVYAGRIGNDNGEWFLNVVYDPNTVDDNLLLARELGVV